MVHIKVVSCAVLLSLRHGADTIAGTAENWFASTYSESELRLTFPRECSKYQAKLPSFGFAEPVKVCTICIAVISRVKKETLPPTVQLQKQMEEQQAQGNRKGLATAVASGRTAAKLFANKMMK